MAKEESTLGSIGRNIGSTALKFLGNVESASQAFDPVGNVVGGLLGLIGLGASGGKESPARKAVQLSSELGFNQNTPQLLESSQVLPQDYLKTRNPIEKFGQNVVSQAPLALLTGGRNLPALLPNIFGNVAAQTGEAAGLGETGQSALQFGTELGTGVLQGGFRPGGLKQNAKQLYNKFRKDIPKSAQTPGKSIAKGIEGIEELLETQTDPKNKNILNELKETLKGLITGTEGTGYKTNPLKLLATRKNVNRQIRNASDEIKELLIPTRDALNYGITDAAAQFPLSVGDVRVADQIYTAKHIPYKVTKFLENNRDKIPTKTLKGAWDLVDTAITAIYQPVRGYKMIAKYPEVMKYYKEMGKAATKNNLNAVIRFGEKINDIVKKSEDIDDTVDLDSIF